MVKALRPLGGRISEAEQTDTPIRHNILTTDRWSEYTDCLFIKAPVNGLDILGNKWAFCPKSCCEARIMGKCKDLSKFDKGQIGMTRQVEQTIFKTASLVGHSQSAVVSIYQKWSTEGTVVNSDICHVHMDFHSLIDTVCCLKGCIAAD